MNIPKKYKRKFTPKPKKKQKQTFPGFPSQPTGNYWPYPKIVNGYWWQLRGSEQKVLDYILRHTWGYEKNSDIISYKQFQEGIWSKKENRWIDHGVGLGETSIWRAIKGLEKKRFIKTIAQDGKSTVFKLRITR